MRLYGLGSPEGQPVVRERVLTVPNAITAVRLAGLPFFVWLLLGLDALGAALVLLMGIAATDWVDGYLARRLDQVSRLGVLMDPLVDRLLLGTAVVTLAVAGLLPWPVVIAVLVRDVLVAGGALVLFGTVPQIAVTRTGKAATTLLYLGVPGFLLAAVVDVDLVRLAAIALTAVGLVAYYGAALQYARAVIALRRGRQARGSDAGE